MDELGISRSWFRVAHSANAFFKVLHTLNHNYFASMFKTTACGPIDKLCWNPIFSRVVFAQGYRVLESNCLQLLSRLPNLSRTSVEEPSPSRFRSQEKSVVSPLNPCSFGSWTLDTSYVRHSIISEYYPLPVVLAGISTNFGCLDIPRNCAVLE